MLHSILSVSSCFLRSREAAYHTHRGDQDRRWLIWQRGGLPWRVVGSCLSGTRELRAPRTAGNESRWREDGVTECVILPTVMR